MLVKPLTAALDARQFAARFIGSPGLGKSLLFIYFVQPASAGLIKIGATKRLKKRFEEMQATSPVRLRVVGVAKGGHRQERALHAHFDEHRAHGEWFNPCPALLDLIARLPEWSESLDLESVPRFTYQPSAVFNLCYEAGYGPTDIAEHFGFSRQRADQLITVRRRKRPLLIVDRIEKPSTPIADFIAALPEHHNTTNPVEIE